MWYATAPSAAPSASGIRRSLHSMELFDLRRASLGHGQTCRLHGRFSHARLQEAQWNVLSVQD